MIFRSFVLPIGNLKGRNDSSLPVSRFQGLVTVSEAIGLTITMDLLLFFAFFVPLFTGVLSQNCPDIYRRFSKDHSYCKPKNPQCSMFHEGVTTAERKQIVDLHNKYRNEVATGKEKRAGGLPQAADMLQMVWDKELAAVAQKRAEQCIYAHDCSECRRVENFSVGQNIAYQEFRCPGSGICPKARTPHWPDVIKLFYDEVAYFDKRYVKSFAVSQGPAIGHFTQMVWAKSWKIGCGYVAFKNGLAYRQLYVCNYGPSGNMLQNPVYTEGAACSSCPANSCCGRSCPKMDYPGLCKLNRNNAAPMYRSKQNFLLYCDFRNSAGDCRRTVSGQGKWKTVQALGGPYIEIVLNGGETSTLKFKKTIKPKQNFCVLFKYRSGPTQDGQQHSISMVANFEMPNRNPVTMPLSKSGSKEFYKYYIDLGWTADTTMSLAFSVPRGASQQYFNLQLLTAKSGKCSQSNLD